MSLHVMLDLETLGAAPDGVVFQVGAVTFDPTGPLPGRPGQLGDPVSLLISPEDAADRGLRLDATTVRWWLERPAVYHGIFARGGPPLRLAEALERLDYAFPWANVAGVWCRGPTFDASILETAYRLCGLRPPWHYRQVRCVRTLEAAVLDLTGRDLVEESRGWFAGDRHDAAVDAVHHARVVCEGYRLLRELARNPGVDEATNSGDGAYRP